jgi:thiol-disulfide isomerase/thioredoxin/predicted negative regulator of RcsB-dependent stress response
VRLVTQTLHLATLLCFLSPAFVAQTHPDYRSNPKFQTAISDGKLLADNEDYDDAIASYQEANEIARGKDKTVLRALIELQITNGDYDDAINTAHAFAAIAITPAEKSYAETSRGRVLFLQAEPQSGSQFDPVLLNSADAAFNAALAFDPKNSAALFTDGEVLVHLGQTEAARARFQACLTSVRPGDPIYVRSQRFAKDPTQALLQLAPAFTVTTLDGSSFNLDQMKGRVVLIDFWATWCGPCMEELPQIKQIAKDFAGQPLVILSLSWDEDEQKWKKFVAKNQMTWPQYCDTNHRIGNLFEVRGLPSYFTIDSDGVLTTEMLGGGFDVEGRLKKLVDKAKAAASTPVN